MNQAAFKLLEPIIVFDGKKAVIITNENYTRTLNVMDSDRLRSHINELGATGSKRLLNIVRDIERTEIFKGSSEKIKKSYLQTIFNRQLRGLPSRDRALIIYLLMEIVFGFHKYRPVSGGFYYKCGESDLADFVARVIMTLKAFAEEMTAVAPVTFNEMKAGENMFGFHTRNTYIEEYYRLEYRNYHEIDLILARFRETNNIWSYGLHAVHCTTPDLGCAAVPTSQINKNKKQEKEDDKMKKEVVEILAEQYAVVSVKFVSGTTIYDYFVPTELVSKIDLEKDTMVVVPANSYCRVPQLALVTNLKTRPSKNTKACKFILDVVTYEEIQEATKRGEKAVELANKQVEIYSELDRRFEQASKLTLWEQAAQNDPKMKELLEQLKAIGGE